MEQVTPELLDLLIQPAFIAEGRNITKVNHAAARLLIREGFTLNQLLQTGLAAYDSFTEGSLYVTLDILGTPWGACVTPTGIGNIFLLDQPVDDPALQMLALAAKELRSPLSDAMIAAQQASETADSAMRETTAHLNRKLYQLLRLVSNMSDASRTAESSNQQLQNMDALFREIFEKTSCLASEAGYALTYEGLQEDVVSLADRQQLERAVLNLVSNAMKFSAKSSTIRCRLTRHEQFLHLQVTDCGSGILPDLLPTVFQRHLRQPAIEDSRCGIGLGMLLVRNAAANHGGVVLITQPKGAGTQVTMTLAIRSEAQIVSCPLQVDYAGERDHALVELADCLPSKVYYKL